MHFQEIFSEFPKELTKKEKIIGETILQGTHQGAQKSTITGCELSRTSALKLLSVKFKSAIKLIKNTRSFFFMQ